MAFMMHAAKFDQTGTREVAKLVGVFRWRYNNILARESASPRHRATKYYDLSSTRHLATLRRQSIK